MDAIPNPPLDWNELNADNVGLYGAVDQFSSVIRFLKFLKLT